MGTRDTELPLLLYHDADSGTVRAATFPPSIPEDAEAIRFRGAEFVRAGSGIVFWDYLVLPNSDIVGVVFNDFDIDESLQNSRLLTNATNVVRDDYGYHIKFAGADEAEIDSSQAFGSFLFEHDGECVLLLQDLHSRGYAFSLDAGLVEPLA